MKRRWNEKILPIILIGIVILFFSLSTFSKVFTGQATVSCSDSDGGLNYTVKGTVTSGGNSYTDYCVSGYSNYNLIEYYCGLSGQALIATYFCPNGCSNGACITLTSTLPSSTTAIPSVPAPSRSVVPSTSTAPSATTSPSSTTTTPSTSTASQINIPSTSTLCYLGDSVTFSCGNYIMNLSYIYRTVFEGITGSGARLSFIQMSPTPSGNIYQATFTKNTSSEVNGSIILGGTSYGVHIEGLPPPNVDLNAVIDSSGSCSVQCPSHSMTLCTDTDGGINYNVKGTVTDASGATFTDWCSYPTILVEGSCSATNTIVSGPYQCPTGQICNDGACVSLGSETNPWQMSATPIIMKYNQDAIFSCNCPPAAPIQLKIESVTGSNALFVDRYKGTGTYYYTNPPTTTTTDAATGIVTASMSVAVKGLEYPVEIITNKSDAQYGNFEQFPYNVLVKVSAPADCFTKSPDCSNKICGDDGCGGSCGTCLTGQTCSSIGKCTIVTRAGTAETCAFDDYKQSDCSNNMRCVAASFRGIANTCQNCIASGVTSKSSPNLCCSSSLTWATRQDTNFCCWANSWTDWGCWWNEKNCGTTTVNDHQVCT